MSPARAIAAVREARAKVRRTARRVEAQVRRKLGKLGRAELRHRLLTKLPDQILGGSLGKRHRTQAIHLREVSLTISGWPEAFDGVRIAHVSDLHVGDLLTAEEAVGVAAMVRKAAPDMVALTGDVVDLRLRHAGQVGLALDAFADCRAALGSYLVLGNHDHLDRPRRLEQLARRAGIEVLHGRVAELAPRDDRKGGALRVGGIDWAGTIRANGVQVNRLVSDGAPPHLLLAHNPKAFRRAAALGIPLTLAGHTHGGQFALREGGGPRHAGRALRRGHYAQAGSHLFVTTGVGAWFPLRVNCPAEVAILTIRRR